MKVLVTSIVLLLAAFAGGAQAQHKEVSGMNSWPELKAFHSIIAQTFHPSEEGNLEPVKTHSGELVQKAQTLAGSTVPAAFDNPKVKAALTSLLVEAKKMDEDVKSGKPDVALKSQISKVHDAFHQIVGLCSKNGHQNEG